MVEEDGVNRMGVDMGVGDGKELFQSEPFRWDSAPQEIDVNVDGVKVLRLEISGNAPRKSLNSVDLADIRLEK